MNGQADWKQVQRSRPCCVRLRILSGLIWHFIQSWDRILQKRYDSITDPGRLADEMAMNMPITSEQKQQVLDACDLKERYEILCSILINEVEIAKIRSELVQKLKGRVDKNQKEYLLREQLRLY